MLSIAAIRKKAHVVELVPPAEYAALREVEADHEMLGCELPPVPTALLLDVEKL